MSETNNPRHTSQGTMAPSSRPHTLMTKTGSPADGKSKQGITIGFVLAALRQWWKVVVPLGLLLGGSGAGLVYLLVPLKYEASAVLRIKEAAPYIVLPSPERPSQRFVQTQIELIKDRVVLGPAVSELEKEEAPLPDLRGEASPIDWLAKEIQVRGVNRSELYKISFSSKDQSSVALVVNAVVKSYFALQKQMEADDIQTHIELLNGDKGEKKRQTDKVEKLRKEVRELAENTSGNDSPLGGTNEDAYVRAELQNRLITAKLEQVVLRMRSEMLKKLTDKDDKEKVEVPVAMVKAAVAASVEIQEMESALAVKEAKREMIKSISARSEKDPAYVHLAEAIKADKETLDQVREKLKHQVEEEMKQDLIDRQESEFASVKDSLERYRIQEELLRKRYNEELQRVKEDRGDTVELEFKQAELDRAGQILEMIAIRTLTLDDKKRAPSQVDLLRSAEEPTAPVERPWKFMTLALLAGLCLPIALAVMWELVVQRVGDAQQLEQHSNITIVGETPRLPVRARMSRGSASRRAARNLEAFEESIDGVRTCLMLSEPLRSMKVLAVTSAVKNEGKTSVASQLAVSIAAAAGQPTLLIDGDMRSPDIHNLFEVPIGPGLAAVLAGKCLCEDAIVTDWGQNVHLLPAGKLYTSPHKLLGNGALNSLLETVRRSYHYVVIDTPPILAASEALVLAKAADATLLCAMQDISRLDQVCKGHHRLLAAGARSAGTVLNGVPRRQYAYRYGSYSYADV